MEKMYQTLQVTYEPGLGKEVWTFFLDPKTAAVEAYRFMFSPGSDEGEYILLDETLTIENLKNPSLKYRLGHAKFITALLSCFYYVIAIHRKVQGSSFWKKQ